MPAAKETAVAFDIGTTTLASTLVDASTGAVLKTLALPNPQRRWGADVLSRITAIKKNPRLLGRMRAAVVGALNEILEKFGKKEIKQISAAGNSVMEHILAGVSPVAIGEIPFRPLFKEPKTMDARSAGLKVKSGTPFYLFPLIGGFVGGDAVGVMLAVGFYEGRKNVLAIDIGTNTEIMLSTPRSVHVTSAAAGPAFEGGEIRCGMTAEKGAIEGVRLNDTVKLDVIGETRPRGICGAGLISAVAEFLRKGIIEKNGRIKDPDEVETNLSARIKKGGGGNSFTLFKGPAREITLFQEDIRALQAAKAAIRAGIEVILEKADISPEKIESVYIAGAFGSGLKKEDLATTGLLRRGWLDRTESIGDAALEGARLTLISEDYKKRAETLAKEAKYIPLSGSRLFEKKFVANMDFMG